MAYQTKNVLFNFHGKLDTIKLPPDLLAYKAKKDSISEKSNPGSTHVTNVYPYIKRYPPSEFKGKVAHLSDSIFKPKEDLNELSGALNQVRMIKSHLLNMNANRVNYLSEYKVFQVQWHKILSNSVACIVMFLIGAPLGSIIKKGGLGYRVDIFLGDAEAPATTKTFKVQ